MFDDQTTPRLTGQQVFNELQRRARNAARESGKPSGTQEYVTRHILESFLDRLVKIGHSRDFVLKGGLLMGAYDARRPTKDIDSNAVSADMSVARLTQVAQDAAECQANDGVIFDAKSIRFDDIRGQGEYPGQRLHMAASVGNAKGTLVWDVSAGDPIVPLPRTIELQRVLGDPITIRAYAPESTVAEKAVTILERGIASTRWRDYVDIVTLDRAQELNRETLRRAVQAVAQYRKVELRPIDDLIAGYGQVGQLKWAAWRRKNNLEDLCQEKLDDQMKLVADIINPVFY